MSVNGFQAVSVSERAGVIRLRRMVAHHHRAGTGAPKMG